MKKPTQIFKHNTRARSEIYGSRAIAPYAVGRPDGPLGVLFFIAENEAKEIVENLPKELLDHAAQYHKLGDAPEPKSVSEQVEELDPNVLAAIKDHYNLVDAASIESELSDGVMGKNQYEEVTDREVDPEESQLRPEEDNEEKQLTEEKSESDQSKDDQEMKEVEQLLAEKDVADMNQKELRMVSRQFKIPNYSNMRNKEMVAAIQTKFEELASEDED